MWLKEEFQSSNVGQSCLFVSCENINKTKTKTKQNKNKHESKFKLFPCFDISSVFDRNWFAWLRRSDDQEGNDETEKRRKSKVSLSSQKPLQMKV